MKLIYSVSIVLFTVMVMATVMGFAEESEVDSTAGEAGNDLFERFEKSLSNVSLIGRFTISGRVDTELTEEKYTIHSIRKMDSGDYWLFDAHIKYGSTDIRLPIPVQVKWAGDTPMISLTNVAIPGLGTFSSRVLFYDGQYAGTWRHGEVYGHMFGRIIPNDTSALRDKENSPNSGSPKP